MTNPLAAKAIFLVGYMGAGKTTVGRLLAERLGWGFLDLDDRTAERAGGTPADVFRHHGEAAFRAYEAQVLKELMQEVASSSRLVIALGGGALTQPGNLDLLRSSGCPWIFLDAPVPELLQRCRDQAVLRPLLRDEGQFHDLFQERAATYRSAPLTVSTSGRTPLHVANDILHSLELTPTEAS